VGWVSPSRNATGLVSPRLPRADRACTAGFPGPTKTSQIDKCKARTSSHSAELRGLQRVDGLSRALRRCVSHWHGATLKRCARTVILRGNLHGACRAFPQPSSV